ncbi:hypothetical protein GLOTRDRAFT_141456 [Gloeophyllum trabeum ATCC 11539]|uniref:Uncharacterized protein n=1 Tax=Gloeophyllum trabeum (strain ATCC 11539 / FP-39264 / Madison 617) TaxID=670483 RepID=S7PTF1_GLOTA|nr:uncharacterized protein GLOTRDRAFT_141456 [Gloeophyllum trabeum ATCC 11539]EPQ50703.1 hypothetical protein GLOTRDRAFT_141456 [Gloeophyllum trabeum ATCC 11539]
MSRRESRNSAASRQNDALLEFENFKKKFLLANKHITKLNTTLSCKVEELQAQISQLYVENLSLRASSIALEAQLRREKEKTRKIMADADDAVKNLMRHFTSIRDAHKIPEGRPSPDKPAPAPRMPRPTPQPTFQMPRLSRAPDIPGINEAEEEEDDDNDADDTEGSGSTPTRRKRGSSARRASGSKLPLPATRQVDLNEEATKTKKKRIARRQSGLLSLTPAPLDIEEMMLSPPRPPSPAFGSPIRREAGLAEEEEERAALSGEIEVDEPEADEVAEMLENEARRERERKERKRAREREGSGSTTTERGRERERKRAAREDAEEDGEGSGGGKLKLKDVTNSPRGRVALPLLDTNPSDRERPDPEIPSSATSAGTTSTFATRNFLSTPATTPAPTHTPQIRASSHLPTPRPSSSPPAEEPAPQPQDADAMVTGRERRVRKSVNYAEPKLNTKMRKPDPPPGSSTSKRTSTSSERRSSAASVPDDAPRPPSSSSSSTGTASRRKKPRMVLDEGEDEDEGAQADAEFVAGVHMQWVNTQGRRKSVHTNSARGRVENDDGRRHSMAV